jgi:hypothetical protein
MNHEAEITLLGAYCLGQLPQETFHFCTLAGLGAPARGNNIAH